ncbi:hypothetical protein TNCV_1107911 [Trichonephila clavipes]|nr:hypothetical protein TNCV_1107911 [Trichonephila clavipes]
MARKSFKSVDSKSSSGNYISRNTYSGTAAVAFQTCLRRTPLERGLVTWQAMGIRHIIEDIAERVAKYADERCLAEKLHLDDMVAQAVQLMLKSCPRNCVPSKCFEGRLEMIEYLNKSLSTLPYLVKPPYASQQIPDGTSDLAACPSVCAGHQH